MDHGTGLSACVNVMGISVCAREYITCFTLGTQVMRCDPTEIKPRDPDGNAVSTLTIKSKSQAQNLFNIYSV